MAGIGWLAIWATIELGEIKWKVRRYTWDFEVTSESGFRTSGFCNFIAHYRSSYSLSLPWNHLPPLPNFLFLPTPPSPMMLHLSDSFLEILPFEKWPRPPPNLIWGTFSPKNTGSRFKCTMKPQCYTVKTLRLTTLHSCSARAITVRKINLFLFTLTHNSPL